MTSTSSPVDRHPGREAVRTVFLVALCFAASEMAIALGHRVLIPRTTFFIVFGLEFGLALAVSAAASVAVITLARLFRRIRPETPLAALRTVGPVVAAPLFFSFYTLNTKGLALLPHIGFQRLFFNFLFVLLAGAALAAAAVFYKRLAGRAADLLFWAGCFFLQITIPAVHFFFFSSVPNPSTPTERLVFLLVLTVPLVAAAWLVSRAGTRFERREARVLAAAGLVLVPLILLAFVPPLSSYRRQPLSLRARTRPGTEAAPNIVFVVWDTARKDRSSLYGHSRSTTPRLAELAADGVTFQNAFSVSPWTLPSHASMFTGLYPSQHLAENSAGEHDFARPLAPEALTLAEILRAEGYRTAALTANHGAMNTSFGLAQGFDYYFDERPHIFDLLAVHLVAKADAKLLRKLRINGFYLSSELNRRVFSWLDTKPASPFFLFLNYMEPHGVNFLPPPDGGRFGGGLDPPPLPTEAILEGRETITPDAYEALATRYDEELACCDAGFGRLVEQLKAHGLYDTSLLIVTSDHGQLFGEHGFFGHRSVLFEDVLAIPLVVKYPRGWSPRSDPEKPFENRELFFLLLEELGIPFPRPPFRAVKDEEGASYTMAEAVFYPGGAERYLERFGGTRVAITRHDPPRPKLILSSSGQDELYLLDEDPGERRNRVDDRADLAARLREAWTEWQPALRRQALAAGEGRDLTQDLKERLRSLGYIVK